MKPVEISVLSAVVVLVCALKFLIDGASVDIAGHVINFGHVDAAAYLGILSPVLAAHGWIAGKTP